MFNKLKEGYNQVQDAINGVADVIQDAFTLKGINQLEAQKTIYVKQELELFEALTGCETENKYNVYAADAEGNIDIRRPLFQSREKSNCCYRQICPGDCRPLKLNVYDFSDIKNPQTGQRMVPQPEQAWSHANKPFKCAWMCFCRPYMEISLKNGGQEEFIGKVVNPWTCCSLDMDVYDKNNNKAYSMSGSCLQLGWLCRQWPCKPCQEMIFTLKDESGQPIGNIIKKSSGCLKACFADVDDFMITFPENCTAEKRTLLMYTMLMIDYQWFEKSNEKDDKKTGGGMF